MIDLTLKKYMAWQIPGKEDCPRCDGNGHYCELPTGSIPDKCPQIGCMSNYKPCRHEVLCSCNDDEILAMLKRMSS